MPLTQDQENLEHEWKVKAMKADMELKTVQGKWEPWKVFTAAAVVSVSLDGVAGYFIGLTQHD